MQMDLRCCMITEGMHRLAMVLHCCFAFAVLAMLASVFTRLSKWWCACLSRALCSVVSEVGAQLCALLWAWPWLCVYFRTPANCFGGAVYLHQPGCRPAAGKPAMGQLLNEGGPRPTPVHNAMLHGQCRYGIVHVCGVHRAHTPCRPCYCIPAPQGMHMRMLQQPICRQMISVSSPKAIALCAVNIHQAYPVVLQPSSVIVS